VKDQERCGGRAPWLAILFSSTWDKTITSVLIDLGFERSNLSEEMWFAMPGRALKTTALGFTGSMRSI